MLGQNQRQLRLHKLNLRKMKQDYKSFDEWHKVDQIFIARDELVRAEQDRIKQSTENNKRTKKSRNNSPAKLVIKADTK